MAFTEAQQASLLAHKPYDFRHAGVPAGSKRLQTPAPLVAEWAGHTVEVLLRIYALHRRRRPPLVRRDGRRSRPGLTWPDGPNLIPRIFREPWLRAASGGISLHMINLTHRAYQQVSGRMA